MNTDRIKNLIIIILLIAVVVTVILCVKSHEELYFVESTLQTYKQAAMYEPERQAVEDVCSGVIAEAVKDNTEDTQCPSQEPSYIERCTDKDSLYAEMSTSNKVTIRPDVWDELMNDYAAELDENMPEELLWCLSGDKMSGHYIVTRADKKNIDSGYTYFSDFSCPSNSIGWIHTHNNQDSEFSPADYYLAGEKSVNAPGKIVGVMSSLPLTRLELFSGKNPIDKTMARFYFDERDNHQGITQVVAQIR